MDFCTRFIVARESIWIAVGIFRSESNFVEFHRHLYRQCLKIYVGVINYICGKVYVRLDIWKYVNMYIEITNNIYIEYIEITNNIYIEYIVITNKIYEIVYLYIIILFIAKFENMCRIM